MHVLTFVCQYKGETDFEGLTGHAAVVWGSAARHDITPKVSLMNEQVDEICPMSNRLLQLALGEHCRTDEHVPVGVPHPQLHFIGAGAGSVDAS
jgi:hypothetical protein